MQPEINIDQTLAERGTRYGEFVDHATITQAIKRAMMLGRNWASLPDDMKESLEMLAHKMGRILNGDPNYHDSWHDIIGYTKLVADRILKDQDNANTTSVTFIEGSKFHGIPDQAVPDRVASGSARTTPTECPDLIELRERKI